MKKYFGKNANQVNYDSSYTYLKVDPVLDTGATIYAKRQKLSSISSELINGCDFDTLGDVVDTLENSRKIVINYLRKYKKVTMNITKEQSMKLVAKQTELNLWVSYLNFVRDLVRTRRMYIGVIKTLRDGRLLAFVYALQKKTVTSESVAIHTGLTRGICGKYLKDLCDADILIVDKSSKPFKYTINNHGVFLYKYIMNTKDRTMYLEIEMENQKKISAIRSYIKSNMDDNHDTKE